VDEDHVDVPLRGLAKSGARSCSRLQSRYERLLKKRRRVVFIRAYVCAELADTAPFELPDCNFPHSLSRRLTLVVGTDILFFRLASETLPKTWTNFVSTDKCYINNRKPLFYNYIVLFSIGRGASESDVDGFAILHFAPASVRSSACNAFCNLGGSGFSTPFSASW
jgi:hypothetical protein